MSVNAIIERLQQVAANPVKAMDEFRTKTGKGVVGCIFPYTPEEIIYASGVLPMGLWGSDCEIKEATRYYPSFFCGLLQSTLEMGLKGKYDELLGVVIPTHCDGLKNMTQNWMYGVKQVPFVDVSYPNNRKIEAGTKFLFSEFKRVKEFIEKVTGVRITDAMLEESIKIYNEHKAVMREFAAAAPNHVDVIKPSVRHAVMKSAFYMRKDEHTALVKELLSELNTMPEYRAERGRIFLTGIMLDSNAVLRCLDDFGFSVVGDDLIQESKQYDTDIPTGIEEPLYRIAKLWGLMDGGSLLHDPKKMRIPILLKEAECTDAQGIVFCVPQFCEYEEYDYPVVKKAAEAEKRNLLYLEINHKSDNIGQISTRLQGFAEQLDI